MPQMGRLSLAQIGMPARGRRVLIGDWRGIGGHGIRPPIAAAQEPAGARKRPALRAGESTNVVNTTPPSYVPASRTWSV
jgi:hypothetical protein